MADIRRVLLDGYPTVMTRDGERAGRRRRPHRSRSTTPCIWRRSSRPRSSAATSTTSPASVEFGVSLPPAPTYFHKPISALNAHACGSRAAEQLQVAELRGRGRDRDRPHVSQRQRTHEAGDYIAGYTVANDFGLHDFRDTDSGSMLRVKGADTLCPLGPGLDHRLGLPRQAHPHAASTARCARTAAPTRWPGTCTTSSPTSPASSRSCPGDVILSGTPADQSRPVQPGDVVTVEVEGLGALTNHIVEGPTPVSDEVGAQPTETEEVLSTALGGDWPLRGQRRPRTHRARRVAVPADPPAAAES